LLKYDQQFGQLDGQRFYLLFGQLDDQLGDQQFGQQSYPFDGQLDDQLHVQQFGQQFGQLDEPLILSLFFLCSFHD
jgi:hypothetical protein